MILICISADGSDTLICLEFFQPLLNEIKGIVNEKVYEHIEELFINCASKNDRYYAVEGMKLAISIMDENYIPKV